jgi:2-keto-3-deoxy-L-rhamnonate aldolase RhmA
MIFSLITNAPDLAKAAESAGIHRIMIDLEVHGKAKRQAGKNLFLSSHRLADVALIKQSTVTANLVVRINPLHEKSGEEIDQVIQAGADYIMLPFFRDGAQVVKFQALVADRVDSILLFETGEAVAKLDEILKLSSCDEIHIGLNDLSLSLGRSNIFDLFLDGTIESIASILRSHGKPFGIGGVGALRRMDLPVSPLVFFMEQIRLGASRGWLGRSFRDGASAAGLDEEVKYLFMAYDSGINADPAALQRNHRQLIQQIEALPAQFRA